MRWRGLLPGPCRPLVSRDTGGNVTMKVHKFLLCVFVTASATLLYGQGGANGTIVGTVTDNSGAVVANANVDITNVATGTSSHATSRSDGKFTVPYLAPHNYTVDRLLNTDTALTTPAVILSQNASQEFKVQSETYSAEYGFSANQVNIVSKSGGNQLHGTAFEFLRNDAFDAKAPFQTVIPELRQNQFGFVLGGPIYIPKVYDGRNKTFFLVNYEGWRIGDGIHQD